MKAQLVILFLFLSYIANSQIVNIPDAGFKTALIEFVGVDTNGDNEIQVSEAESYTDELLIDANNTYFFSDITGIEAFIHTNSIFITGNQISTAPLPSSSDLYELTLSNNYIQDIDVSVCPNLQELFLDGNLLTTLDVSNNPSLLDLSVANNPNLTYINMQNGNNMGLGTIDFSNLPNLDTVCVDDLSFTDLTDLILNQVGHSVNFVDNCSSSVREDRVDSFRINPNPVRDVLDIDIITGIKKVSIYDTTGKLIISGKKNNINTSNLDAGLYFIRILTGDNKILSTKFIKK